MAFTPFEIKIGSGALGGGVVGGLILKIVWDWLKIRRNGNGVAVAQPAGVPSPAPGVDVIASDVAATREVAEKVKSDTSHLKLADSERAQTLGKICDSNARQETMMGQEIELLKTIASSSAEQVQLLKKNGGR